jgi:hypothetical protein
VVRGYSISRSSDCFATTLLGAENSEVLPPGPVAVAVMFTPNATLLFGENLKEALPLPSVLTRTCLINFLPSSVPEGLEKNWTRNLLPGVLSSLAFIVVVPPVLAEAIIGKFCRLLGPASRSPGSLAVRPSEPRSIPGPPLLKIELERTRLQVI